MRSLIRSGVLRSFAFAFASSKPNLTNHRSKIRLTINASHENTPPFTAKLYDQPPHFLYLKPEGSPALLKPRFFPGKSASLFCCKSTRPRPAARVCSREARSLTRIVP